MMQTIEECLSLPQEGRDGAAYIVALIEDVTRALSLSKKDIAASLATLHFA